MANNNNTTSRSHQTTIINNPYAIRQEIQRFESVHPSIYAIYDLIELIPDIQVATQVREHLVNIEGKLRPHSVNIEGLVCAQSGTSVWDVWLSLNLNTASNNMKL